MQQQSISPLQQLIAERIKREGAITFADYMQIALYEPQYGYYTSGASRVGWEGDFYTSSDVADFFAHCMARQLYHFWQQMNCPTPFIVLEQGAGRGNLAHQVRIWAEREQPDFHAALRYHTHDIHSGQDALSTPGAPSTGDLLSPAVILSNELVDAFPVHIVEKRGGRLYEIYVTLQNERLIEALAEPGNQQVADYLDTYKIPWAGFADGWRAEINLAALEWMCQTVQLSGSMSPRRGKRQYILTIDYGEKARMLYTRDRYRGTLACYFKHQLLDRPLIRPGQQDITAHVNFSALIDEGRRQGLHVSGYLTQQHWLEAMGIREELDRIRQRDFAVLDTARASNEGQAALLKWYNLTQRVSALTDPAGMGNFKVLILSR
jgi:SAM-dependent MidA family methyltransferase